MASQLQLPELALENDEALLRRAWSQLPWVKPEQYETLAQVPCVRRCLLHVAEAQLKQEAPCRRNYTKS